MNVLVTGGAGFVGSVLVPALLSRGHSVTVLDWFIFEPLLFSGTGVRRVRGDIRDRKAVATSLAGTNAVIHLAALANDPSSELDPALTKEINFDAVRGLVHLAKEAGVRRFVNASSASVYGIREEERVIEGLTPMPVTAYARWKAESEALALGESCASFVVTSVRPATLCGYAPRLRLDLTANMFTYQAVCHKQITVFGGEQYRPSLSVQDMADVYISLLEADATLIGGQTFNVASENLRVIEIADRIKTIVGDQVVVEVVDQFDLRSYRLCCDRIRETLGFKPKVSLERAITELAAALCDGRVRSPSGAKYRNLEMLKQNMMFAEQPCQTINSL